MSGKTRSERFHIDDEVIILRKSDGINEYFGNRDINDITTYDLRDYLTVLNDNRVKGLSASLKSKHLIIISKILKIAYEKDSLDKIFIIPKVYKKDNPRPSFTEKQYKLLLSATREVVDEGVKVRGIQITDELYYFIVFMVYSFLKPTESKIFTIQHQDIEIKVKGKTGFRIVSTMPDALDFYDKLRVMNPDYKPNDYIFFKNYPNRSTAIRNINRQFNYILNRINLKENADGQLLTPYALRHYSLQTRLVKCKAKVNHIQSCKKCWHKC